MAFKGADTDQLRTVATTLDNARTSLEQLLATVVQQSQSLSWTGDDAVRFHDQAQMAKSQAGLSLVSMLEAAATSLRTNATQQDDTSATLEGGAFSFQSLFPDGWGHPMPGLLGPDGTVVLPPWWENFHHNDFGDLSPGTWIPSELPTGDFVLLADGLMTVRDGQEAISMLNAGTLFDGAKGIDGWGAVGIGLGVIDTGLNAAEYGWGDARTLTSGVDTVGGTVAGYVAGPAGSLVWSGGMAIGDAAGSLLDEHFDTSGKWLEGVYGDTSSMTPAEADRMAERVANPLSFAYDTGKAIVDKVWPW